MIKKKCTCYALSFDWLRKHCTRDIFLHLPHKWLLMYIDNYGDLECWVLKVKVYVYSPDIPSRLSGLSINYPQLLHLPGMNVAQFSATVVIHTVSIFVPPGTHYCWVDSGGEDSKLVHDTWPALQESNPRPYRYWVQRLNNSTTRSTIRIAIIRNILLLISNTSKDLF